MRPHYSAVQLRELQKRAEDVMPDRPNYAPGKCAWCSMPATYKAFNATREWVWPSCGVHSFDNPGTNPDRSALEAAL